jgi:hypothetical protein
VVRTGHHEQELGVGGLEGGAPVDQTLIEERFAERER